MSRLTMLYVHHARILRLAWVAMAIFLVACNNGNDGGGGDGGGIY
jgi:hypothetical protein